MTTRPRDGEHPADPNRRQLLAGAGAAGLATLFGPPAFAQAPSVRIDHRIRIEPMAHEIAPGKIVRTTAYNGQIPGRALRLREGVPVAIEVVNASGYPNLIHWHGQFLAARQDGAVEEGSPIIPVGKSLVYAYTPRPAGTRWYHSHAYAGVNLARSTYSGEYGFLIVEPAAGDPGRYDREVLLAAHHWDGRWVSLQDFEPGPPKDNGLEVVFAAATLDSRMLGHDDPIRVRQGERVLFRLLNASASEGIKLALPGHKFTVIALDGNAVPTRARVDVLELDVAERVDVIVEMNNPGVWVFGETRDDRRKMGLGAVIEYAGYGGPPQWRTPTKSEWDYTVFGRNSAVPKPDEIIALKFEKIAGGRSHYNRWTINGKSWPDTNPLFEIQQGKRYRLLMNNANGDGHPVHLHRHSFELTRIGNKTTSGIIKDSLAMEPHSTAEIDFVADNPGPTFFHCHNQDHMDEGFAALISYAR